MHVTLHRMIYNMLHVTMQSSKGYGYPLTLQLRKVYTINLFDWSE